MSRALLRILRSELLGSAHAAAEVPSTSQQASRSIMSSSKGKQLPENQEGREEVMYDDEGQANQVRSLHDCMPLIGSLSTSPILSMHAPLSLYLKVHVKETPFLMKRSQKLKFVSRERKLVPRPPFYRPPIYFPDVTLQVCAFFHTLST